MRTRSWELVTADESTVIAKTVFNSRVMEDLECDGGFSNPTCANESNGLEVFGDIYDVLN